MSGAASWTVMPERGSIGALRLMARIALSLGWHAAHALLYPITAFYLVSAPPAQRRAARRYLARALGRPAHARDLFRLYFAFAATMLDRVFLLTGRTGEYEVTVEGLDRMKAFAEIGQGCILLGAHIGSFDALWALAGADAPVEVRILMHRDNARKANTLFDALDPARTAAIIPLGQPDAMLRAKECLDGGGVLGLLGDRAPRGERMLAVPFLGAAAPLPAGPMQLAAVLGAPVLLCFGLWLGPRRYQLRFEPFADRIALDRGAREEAVAAWLARYGARLEQVCRAHPYNWFNFYDFWQEER